VKIYNPNDPSKSMERDLLVDTGSTYTWIKRSRPEELGIKPLDRRRLRTIESKVVEREVGEAIVECLGRRATTIVVFAEEGDAELLGLHALEGLGLEVDPATRRLREAEAILALTTLLR
jgi:clan AA aspartic protease